MPVFPLPHHWLWWFWRASHVYQLHHWRGCPYIPSVSTLWTTGGEKTVCLLMKNFTICATLIMYYLSLLCNAVVFKADLISLISLELLELPLEAQVGASTGPGHPHRSQCLLPTQSCHRHDVSNHQGDTAGHTCQTVWKKGMAKEFDECDAWN